MTRDEAERLVAETIARAAAVDPAMFPVVQGGTPVDDALAALFHEMQAAGQAMSEEIVEAGVKVVFPPLDLDDL
jgi:hypothetical protein